MAPALTPGRVIDRYELEEELGVGSFGSVWRARHTVLHATHAVKILHTDLGDRPILRDRFLQEGRIQAQLVHPNIVRVTDVVDADGFAMLVMDHVAGPSLEDHLRARKHPLTLDEAIRLLRPVLDALQLAHERGVVHRDMKPANILLAGGMLSHPRVVDFGIAKVADHEAVRGTGVRGTAMGTQMGTASYMSPEQIKGAVLADARSDVFACGAILYELLTLDLAFDGGSNYEVWEAIVRGPRPSVTGTPALAARFGPGADAVDELLAKATATDPDTRYASCGALALALEALPHALATTVTTDRGEPSEGASERGTPSPPPFRPSLPGDGVHGAPAPTNVLSRRTTYETGRGTLSDESTEEATIGRTTVSTRAARHAAEESARPWYLWPEVLGGAVLALALIGFMLWGRPAPGADRGFAVEGVPFPARQVPAGTFTMGSADDEVGRDPDETLHPVTLTRPYVMSQEVTVAQWHAVLETEVAAPAGCAEPTCPVDRVSWYDAAAFANALSEHQGLPPCYALTACTGTPGTGLSCDDASVTSDDGTPGACEGWRLPTEAEWEHAARAGHAGMYAGGDDPDAVAWHPGNAGGHLHPVCSRAPNAWGLCDLSGNAWEWVHDGYGPLGDGAAEDPVGAPDAGRRVRRSGSIHGDTSYVRVANRFAGMPGGRAETVGFRVVRTGR